MSVFVSMEGRWAKTLRNTWSTSLWGWRRKTKRWTSASFIHCPISFYILCTMQARFYMRALWVEIAITHTGKTIFADPENKHKIHASTLVITHDLTIQPHNLQSWHSAFMPLTCTSWHLIYDLSLHIHFAIFHPLPTTFICSSRIKLPLTTDLDSQTQTLLIKMHKVAFIVFQTTSSFIACCILFIQRSPLTFDCGKLHYNCLYCYFWSI